MKLLRYDNKKMYRSFSFRSMISCFLLMIFIISFTKLPAEAVTATDAYEREGTVIVSLGDSYSSGEGIEPFYGQELPYNEKKGNADWLAHRSMNSWSGMLTLPAVDGTMAENRGTNWFFAAASGATTYHLKNRQSKTTSSNLFNRETHTLPPQLSIFDELGGRTADYVTFTLGGNDADFVGIITTAATSSSNDHLINDQDRLRKLLDSIWARFWEKGGIRDSLKQAYKDIENKAGKQAHIIVAGYPTLLDSAGSNYFFSAKEAEIINNAAHEFNSEIEKLVDECRAAGMRIHFVSVEEAFRGHEAYTDDPYINPIYFGRNSQDLEWIQAVSSYSMHPNIKGARAYARCVQAKIDELEAAKHPREISDKLDAVLVLDASGKMAGTPIKETVKAADGFLNLLLGNGAAIGAVAYGRNAVMISDFTKNGAYLSSVMKDIEAAGSRNIEAGLRTAAGMFKGINAPKKVVILVSSGDPNSGSAGNDLAEYADSLKDQGFMIYTLGFSARSSGDPGLQKELENIAGEGYHFEAGSADELALCFNDIADELIGEKKIYYRLTGPADVAVSYDEEMLSSGAADYNSRSGFGTLTLLGSSDPDERVTVLRLKAGSKYNVSLSGIGDGTIGYSVGFMDDNGRYTDIRSFQEIPVTPDTLLNGVIDKDSSSALIFDDTEDNDTDAEIISTFLPEPDHEAGKERNVDNAKTNAFVTIAIILSAVIAAAAILTPLLILRSRNKTEVR